MFQRTISYRLWTGRGSRSRRLAVYRCRRGYDHAGERIQCNPYPQLATAISQSQGFGLSPSSSVFILCAGLHRILRLLAIASHPRCDVGSCWGSFFSTSLYSYPASLRACVRQWFLIFKYWSFVHFAYSHSGISTSKVLNAMRIHHVFVCKSLSAFCIFHMSTIILLRDVVVSRIKYDMCMFHHVMWDLDAAEEDVQPGHGCHGRTTEICSAGQITFPQIPFSHISYME